MNFPASVFTNVFEPYLTLCVHEAEKWSNWDEDIYCTKDCTQISQVFFPSSLLLTQKRFMRFYVSFPVSWAFCFFWQISPPSSPSFRDLSFPVYVDIYCMFVCVTYISCIIYSLGSMHQKIYDHKPPLSLDSCGKIREKVTVRGRVALHMSGERSDCCSVMKALSTQKSLSTCLRPWDINWPVIQCVAPGQQGFGNSPTSSFLTFSSLLSVMLMFCCDKG